MSVAVLELFTQFAPERIVFNLTNQQCSRRGLFVNANQSARRRRRAVRAGVNYYSDQTLPAWHEAHLGKFPRSHPQVMLSCVGQAWLTEAALSVMQYLPLRKPSWQCIPALNTARRWLHWPAAKHSRQTDVSPSLAPVSQS